MNPSQLRGDLPEPVRRYFLEVAKMTPPADLLDAAVAEIERTPRINRFSAAPILGFAAAAAVVVGLLIYTFMNPAPPDVGDEPTPSPSTSQAVPTETPEPTPLPIATLAPIEGLPSAGAVIATYDVGDAGHPVLSAHGSVWLSNAAAGTLTRMDPATGELGAVIDVNPDPQTDRYDLSAVADDRWVWATGVDNSVVKIDPQTDEVVDRFDIGTLMYRMVLHDGSIWVTNLDQGGRLIRFDTASEEVAIEEFYSNWPAALAVTDSDVWMAPYQGDDLWRIDPATGQGVEMFEVAEFSMQISVIGDSLYLTGNQGRPAERFSTTDGAAAARVPEMALAAAGDRLYGITYDGAVMELDLATLQPTSALTIEGGETYGGLFADGLLYLIQGEADPRIVVVDPGN
jgi:streptogramin lyase